MLKIVSLDPGVTSGYALAVVEDPSRVFIAYGENRMTVRDLWDGLIKLSPDILICEDFEYRNRARAGLDLTPVKMIGVVELWASPVKVAYGKETKGFDVYFQKAAEGKGHFSNEKLKEIGVYQKGVNHGRDACRHLLHWLQFGAGFQYVDEPALTLVDASWILGAYWNHIDVWR